MQAETDVYIEPKDSKRHLADDYWDQKAHLLLPHRLWLPLARVAAVTLRQKALGSIWTPCRPYKASWMPALGLYFNSSVGILSMLGERDNRKPSYPSFSLDTLRSLPVPDMYDLDEHQIARMLECHYSLKGKTLLPFPQMMEDPVRREIDDCVSEVIGLDKDWLESVRAALCREPAITGSSHTA